MRWNNRSSGPKMATPWSPNQCSTSYKNLAAQLGVRHRCRERCADRGCEPCANTMGIEVWVNHSLQGLDDHVARDRNREQLRGDARDDATLVVQRTLTHHCRRRPDALEVLPRKALASPAHE